MARIRSLTDPYIDRMPPERMAAVVIRTTGATIASIALIAMGFIELHERHSPGAKDEPLMVSPGKTTRTDSHDRPGCAGARYAELTICPSTRFRAHTDPFSRGASSPKSSAKVLGSCSCSARMTSP
jgi:hypothetical protein